MGLGHRERAREREAAGREEARNLLLSSFLGRRARAAAAAASKGATRSGGGVFLLRRRGANTAAEPAGSSNGGGGGSQFSVSLQGTLLPPVAFTSHSMMERSKSVEDYKMSKGVKRSKNDLKQKKGHTGGDKEHNSSNGGWKGKSRKNENTRGQLGVKKNHRLTNSSMTNKTKAAESLKAQGLPTAQASFPRKKVDPETANYFYRIANLFENNEIDLEERSVICGNALEETRGKELELSTDVIISRTLQTLLEGCDSDQLCSFLLNSANVFSYIATDKCGSHVAETALRSLAAHAQDQFTHSTVADILMKICEEVVVDSVNVMSSPYGSHVLRSLICICKGLPMDALEEYHNMKSFSALAERLNPQSSGKKPHQPEHGFPDTFKFLVMETLRHSKDDIATLCVNKYSSLTVLKLLVGDNEGLLHAILVLLGCTKENVSEGCLVETTKVHGILDLLEDTASSHLLEVILEVAPEDLYDEILTKIFRGSLSKISAHHCGNFVVQALLSSAKSQGQVNMIWAELHPQLKHLLEMGKSGVIASLLAACQRLQTHGHECCQMLADAVCLDSEFPCSIVPHILYLESYFSCKDKSNWQWPVGEKMHTLGCLMLQTVFRYPKKIIQLYIRSVLSMDADLIVQMANDAGGGRVLESFLCSDLSPKQKLKYKHLEYLTEYHPSLSARLQDHFGELSMQPSGSFTVERCFDASDLSLKETIASELLAVRAELSKMKHGPYILKKLDVDGLDTRPEQWRKRQATKEMTYREFQATFGSDSNGEDKNRHVFSKKAAKRNKKKILEHIQEPDVSPVLVAMDLEFPGLNTSMARLGFPDSKHGHKRKRVVDATTGSESLSKASISRFSMLEKHSGKGRSSVADLADLATKKTLTAAEIQSLFKGTTKKAKKKRGHGWGSSWMYLSFPYLGHAVAGALAGTGGLCGGPAEGTGWPAMASPEGSPPGGGHEPPGGLSFAKVVASSLAFPEVSIDVHHPTFTDQGEPTFFFSKAEMDASLRPFLFSVVANTTFGRPAFFEIRSHLTARFFKWTPLFKPSADPTVVSVWVEFPELPVNLYHKKLLASIACNVGPVLQIAQSSELLLNTKAARDQADVIVAEGHPPALGVLGHAGEVSPQGVSRLTPATQDQGIRPVSDVAVEDVAGVTVESEGEVAVAAGVTVVPRVELPAVSSPGSSGGFPRLEGAMQPSSQEPAIEDRPSPFPRGFTAAVEASCPAGEASCDAAPSPCVASLKAKAAGGPAGEADLAREPASAASFDGDLSAIFSCR
ncbi:hypothetical protein Taro_048877, partial [Colocasia esculenta]|nr:hypothetical protein [Colocasia esculenta]